MWAPILALITLHIARASRIYSAPPTGNKEKYGWLTRLALKEPHIVIDFVPLVLSRHAVIGASLSEPYTSWTALRKCVCMLVGLWPYTVNF